MVAGELSLPSVLTDLSTPTRIRRFPFGFDKFYTARLPGGRPPCLFKQAIRLLRPKMIQLPESRCLSNRTGSLASSIGASSYEVEWDLYVLKRPFAYTPVSTEVTYPPREEVLARRMNGVGRL